MGSAAGSGSNDPCLSIGTLMSVTSQHCAVRAIAFGQHARPADRGHIDRDGVQHTTPRGSETGEAASSRRHDARRDGGARGKGDYAMTAHHMRQRWGIGRAGVLGVALAARTALGAGLEGAWEGTFGLPSGQVAVVGTLSGSPLVNGTLSISSDNVTLRGQYLVSGRAGASKARLRGMNASGVTLKWSGKAAGGGYSGKASVKGAGVKGKGPLALALATPPPPSCDSSFFDVQVMERVMKPVCAACHAPGGPAELQGGRLRVIANDPPATMQSVRALIDTNDPASSRLLQKPLGNLNHGGGAVLLQSSAEWGLLQQWAQLVASGQECSGTGANVSLVPMGANELLVRASTDLRGIRPSLADLDAVTADPNQYQPLVEQYLRSSDFLERVKDI